MFSFKIHRHSKCEIVIPTAILFIIKEVKPWGNGKCSFKQCGGFKFLEWASPKMGGEAPTISPKFHGTLVHVYDDYIWFLWDLGVQEQNIQIWFLVTNACLILVCFLWMRKGNNLLHEEVAIWFVIYKPPVILMFSRYPWLS